MRALFALCLQLGVVVSASASVILVPSVQPTIQAGINAATPGDTVQVAPGTYTGPSNRNLDFGGKSIVLRSSAGPGATIIDCQNLARGMRFHMGETAAAIVQGFTILDGLANGTFGGGILVEGGARPTIRNCRFQSNHANSGGGVFVSSGVTLTDCDFEDNSADNYGGGAYGETADLQAIRCSFTQNTSGSGGGISVNFGATVILTDCSFTENDPANLGGGVHSSASSIEIRRCSFLRNTGKHGAGAYLIEGSATVDSCTFDSNTATYSGGGLHAEEIDPPLTVTRCTFQSNVTLGVSFQFHSFGGGGLYTENHPLDGGLIADCIFIANEAHGINGGGGGGLREFSGALVERCAFINNISDDRGGGAYAHGRLHDCIFEGNSSPIVGGVLGGSELIDCRFTNNHSDTFGGGCGVQGGGADPVTVPVVRCEFTGNSAGARGGGLYWVSSFYSLLVEDCLFRDNSSLEGGGIFALCGQPGSIDECTLVGNTATLGGALKVQGPTPAPVVTVTGCTIVANTALTSGGGLQLTIPVQIANTIIAFGAQGEAIACEESGVGVMSCTDIFGNAGGNWTACIADQLGINGNFSLDPIFCNRAGRDFTLAQASPCSPAHSPAGCGLIGAHPVACATPIGIADAGSPSVAAILRVTPNPMRGVGMIEWSGVGGRETELRLYDVAGRLVAQRVETSEVGRMPWSSLVGGSGVASGVYFLEIGAEHSVDTRVRLVLIQ